MPFSAGVFSRVYSWATEQLSSPIEIAKLDTQEDDIATGLSNCILRDGTGIPTAATSWNSQKITGLGDAAADTDALNRQTADIRFGKTAVKAATTSRSSTASLADDPHLALALTTGTWAVELWAPYWSTTSVTGGFQWAMAFSGTATNSGYSGVTPSGVNNATKQNGSALGAVSTIGSGVNLSHWLRITGVITVSAGGNLTFQWAQAVSNADAANVGIGAWMIARKIA